MEEVLKNESNVNQWHNNLFNELTEKKICTPQHSINGYVPKKDEFQYHGQTCDCKKLKWVKTMTCGCPADSSNATYELLLTPNQ